MDKINTNITDDDGINILIDLINNYDKIKHYSNHFASFNYKLKRHVEKGHMLLEKITTDTMLKYFSIEQVFSEICFLMENEGLINKYQIYIEKYLNFETINGKIEYFKNLLLLIKNMELDKMQFESIYIESLE